MERLTHVISTNDWDGLGEVFHTDAVLEYPQSGERFLGLAKIRGQFENYPNMDAGTSQVQEIIGGTRYALTPSYTVIDIEGSGDNGTAVIRIRYADGSWWWGINIYELRGDRIQRSRTYFAQDFPAPDWRAPYRETP
jgi:SnoaL-like domain